MKNGSGGLWSMWIPKEGIVLVAEGINHLVVTVRVRYLLLKRKIIIIVYDCLQKINQTVVKDGCTIPFIDDVLYLSQNSEMFSSYLKFLFYL